MHKNAVKIIALGFLGFGILFLCISVIAGVQRMSKLGGTENVIAEIIDIESWYDYDDTRYEVTVEYEYGGKVVETPIDWYSSGMRVGGTVELLVNEDDPYDIMAAGFMGWILSLIFGIFGIVFGGIGGGLLVAIADRKKLEDWLFQNGLPVWATVEGIDDDWSVRVNGKPAQVIMASYDGMQFKSGPVDNNDIRRLEDVVRIYIHPNDYNKYVFDLRR